MGQKKVLLNLFRKPAGLPWLAAGILLAAVPANAWAVIGAEEGDYLARVPALEPANFLIVGVVLLTLGWAADRWQRRH